MKVLIDEQDFGLVFGLNWLRWYVGMAIEITEEHRTAVFRLGPLVINLITRR